jgi:hypothetical protein
LAPASGDGGIKGKAKKLLAGVPGLYRATSAAYRSLGVVQEMAYVAENAPRIMMGSRAIVVTYPSQPTPRWGFGRPGEPRLAAIIERGRASYEQLIRQLGTCRAALERIAETPPAGDDTGEPFWSNGFFTGLDAASAYGILATHRPRRFLEVGSGFSTRVARRALRDQGLATRITSIDPSPQSAIDPLCDVVIRKPLQEADTSLFDELEAGDVLFFDGSHYAFMSSDVVVLWVEIVPRLKPGVLIHVHDIFLPYDYPPDWVERYYSEQYLLAVALQAPEPSVEVMFPCQFVAQDPALSRLVVDELGPRASLDAAASFWLRKR